jgi:prepilin signal peptidase PulO-like enzyme (type II secretory pathway)
MRTWTNIMLCSYKEETKFLEINIFVFWWHRLIIRKQFYKFISKRRIISLMYSFALPRIWRHFMALYLFFIYLFFYFLFFFFAHYVIFHFYFFDHSITEKT